MFGELQHRTFPIYFSISIALSSTLLGLWTWALVLTHYLTPTVADVSDLPSVCARFRRALADGEPLRDRAADEQVSRW